MNKMSIISIKSRNLFHFTEQKETTFFCQKFSFPNERLKRTDKRKCINETSLKCKKGIFMKKRVIEITVDRPLGSVHPNHNDMIYPINYGYVKGIIAPDGEEQDVYILGVDIPVAAFTGKVIAIIHRNDDVEEKWVACPKGMTFSKEEIMKQVYFTEQFFDSSIEML